MEKGTLIARPVLSDEEIQKTLKSAFKTPGYYVFIGTPDGASGPNPQPNRVFVAYAPNKTRIERGTLVPLSLIQSPLK